MRRSSAQLFFVYMVFGLFALLIEIAVAKFLGKNLDNISIFLALAIGLSNLLSIVGYSSVVINDNDLLADQESADLAYYLGFSLTVGALAFSFLFDILTRGAGPAAQMAQADSALISGSLAQFGAGLLATLFGLAAKIKITSLQTATHLDPDDLYRQFRLEVNSFSLLIRDLSNDLKDSVRRASEGMAESGKSAVTSFSELTRNIELSSRAIQQNLSSDKIRLPVQTFSEQMELLSQPLILLNKNLSDLNASISSNQTAFRSGSDQIVVFDQSLRNTVDSFNKLSESTSSSVSYLEASVQKIGKLANSADNSAEGLMRLTETSKVTAANFDELAASARAFFESINSNRSAITLLSETVSDIDSCFKNLNAATTVVNSALIENKNINAEIIKLWQTSTKSISEFGGVVQSISSEVRALGNSVSSNVEKFKLNSLSVDDASVAFEKLRELLGTLNTALADIGPSATSINQNMKSLSESIAKFFSSTSAVEQNITFLEKPVQILKSQLENLSQSLNLINSRMNK
jgi:methyl-accepting chemotaxis protein